MGVSATAACHKVERTEDPGHIKAVNCGFNASKPGAALSL